MVPMPAGVQALVVVVCALVVFGRDHRNNSFTISKGQYRNFRPGQELFNDNAASRIAELAFAHHLVDCFDSLGFICGDNNAFAQCKAVPP